MTTISTSAASTSGWPTRGHEDPLMTAHRKKALFVLNPQHVDEVYGGGIAERIGALADVIAPPQTAAALRSAPELLAGVEVIFGGWGVPVMDAEFLRLAPKLEAVF